MAPQELIGRYKEYKFKTRGLVNWMVSTASEVCDLSNLLASFASKSAAGTETVIRTVELAPLAKAIASAAVTIPEGIVLIASDVIAGREACADWYSAQGLDSEADGSNRSHRHFIAVLQEVVVILGNARKKQSAASAESAKNKRGKKQADPRTAMCTMFEALELEEPGDNPLGKENARPQPAAPQAWRRIYKIEGEDGEAALEVWCFLQDLADLRKSAMDIWRDYAKGEISFLAAGLITETAFGLMRRLDEAFAKSFGSTDWTRLMQYLGLGCQRDHRDGYRMQVFSTKKNIVSKPQSRTVNVADMLCPVAHLCLSTFRDNIERSCKDKRPPGVMRYTVVHHEHLYHHMSLDLLKIQPEIHTCAHVPEQVLMLDELTHGLVGLHLDPRGLAPMWLVVAMQTYLDMSDLLGPYTYQGVTLLREQRKNLEALSADLLAYCRTVPSTAKADRDELRGYADRIKGLVWEVEYLRTPEETPSLVSQSADDVPESRPGSSRERIRVGALPVYGGVYVARVALNMHAVGLTLASHNDFVLTMAHIYRCSRARGLLKVVWQDMEFAISSFSPRDPLVPNDRGPYNFSRAVEHYFLATGMKTKDFSDRAMDRAKYEFQGQRLSVVKVRNRSRDLVVKSVLLCALMDQRVYAERDLSDSQTFEAIINPLADDKSANASQHFHRAKKAHKAPMLTGPDVLVTLRRKLTHDEPTLHFDFARLSLDCAYLLQDFTKLLDGFFPGGYRDWYSGLAQFILHNTVDTAGQALAAKVAAALGPYIEKKGKQYVKAANDQSTGRIPKHLRLEIEAEQRDMLDVTKEQRAVYDALGTSNSFSGDTLVTYDPAIVVTDGEPIIMSDEDASPEDMEFFRQTMSPLIPPEHKDDWESGDPERRRRALWAVALSERGRAMLGFMRGLAEHSASTTESGHHDLLEHGQVSTDN